MRPSRSFGWSLSALLALAACGAGGGEGQGNVNANAAAEGLPATPLDPAEEVALADEAAADEAADTELYGGNAAAGETSNTSAAQLPTHTPAGPPAAETPPPSEPSSNR